LINYLQCWHCPSKYFGYAGCTC